MVPPARPATNTDENATTRAVREGKADNGRSFMTPTPYY
jgi:hypothetical protein